MALGLGLGGGAALAATPEQVALAAPALRLAVLSDGGLSDGGLSAQARPVARALLQRLGYGAAAPGLMQYRWGVAPVLTYDPNINGGYADSTVLLGGLNFALSPALVGRSGLMGGLRADTEATFGLSGRVALDLAARGRMVRALSEDSVKSEANARLCLRRMGRALTEVRGCIDRTIARTQLSASAQTGVELGLSHPFVASQALAEAGVFLRHQRVSSGGRFGQWQAGGALTRIGPAGVRLDLGAALGAPVADHAVMRQRVTLGVLARVLGDWTRLSLGVEQRRGGVFLGTPRQEIATSLSLQRSFAWRGRADRRLDMTVTATQVAAGQALLNRQGISVDVGMRF